MINFFDLIFNVRKKSNFNFFICLNMLNELETQSFKISYLII